MNFLKVCSTELTPTKVKNLCKKYPVVKTKRVRFVRGYTTDGSPGSGAGKGGGAGGSVKESGGGLGRYAVAQEEGFFYNQQKEQIKKMKQKLKEEGEKDTTPEQTPEKK